MGFGINVGIVRIEEYNEIHYDRQFCWRTPIKHDKHDSNMIPYMNGLTDNCTLLINLKKCNRNVKRPKINIQTFVHPLAKPLLTSVIHLRKPCSCVNSRKGNTVQYTNTKHKRENMNWNWFLIPFFILFYFIFRGVINCMNEVLFWQETWVVGRIMIFGRNFITRLSFRNI